MLIDQRRLDILWVMILFIIFTRGIELFVGRFFYHEAAQAAAGKFGWVPVAAAAATTPPTVTLKTVGNRKVHSTIKLPTFDGKLNLESFWQSCKIVRIIIGLTKQITRESVI